MCGIFGIINRKPSKFDYSTFCTLGIANDIRGGDSCGIFIDGKTEYGIGKEKFFEDFFLQSELLNDTERATIALGHCRKASVGAINLATAQPIVIQDENNNTKFVVIHNGTIYNYKELAEKYIPDIDITGLTDSQVMARIFYYKGYDVLSEYNGGSVFVIVDYRTIKPKVLFFKGVSKKYDTSTETTEERPLYLCFSKDKLVFSSIYTYLAALCPDMVIYTGNANSLTQYEDGKLIKVRQYDRSKCVQQRAYTETKSTGLYEEYAGYLSFALKKFRYSLDGGKKIPVGPYFINEWGGTYKNKPTYTASTQYYFFHGIPFLDRSRYDYVWEHYTKAKTCMEDFIADNETLIRFLSSNPFIFKDNRLFTIKDPDHVEPYTGNFVPIGGSRKSKYNEGIFVCEVYDYSRTNFNYSIKDINLNSLNSLWKL